MPCARAAELIESVGRRSRATSPRISSEASVCCIKERSAPAFRPTNAGELDFPRGSVRFGAWTLLIGTSIRRVGLYPGFPRARKPGVRTIAVHQTARRGCSRNVRGSDQGLRPLYALGRGPRNSCEGEHRRALDDRSTRATLGPNDARRKISARLRWPYDWERDSAPKRFHRPPPPNDACLTCMQRKSRFVPLVEASSSHSSTVSGARRDHPT